MVFGWYIKQIVKKKFSTTSKDKKDWISFIKKSEKIYDKDSDFTSQNINQNTHILDQFLMDDYGGHPISGSLEENGFSIISLSLLPEFMWNTNMVKDNQILDNKFLLNMINDHIKKKKASSFIRKGDGENIVIGYKSIDEIKIKNSDLFV